MQSDTLLLYKFNENKKHYENNLIIFFFIDVIVTFFLILFIIYFYRPQIALSYVAIAITITNIQRMKNNIADKKNKYRKIQNKKKKR